MSITHEDIAKLIESNNKLLKDNNTRLCTVQSDMSIARKTQDDFLPTMKDYVTVSKAIEKNQEKFLMETKDMFHSGMERLIQAQVDGLNAVVNQKNKFTLDAKMLGALLGTIMVLVFSLIAVILGVDKLAQLKELI